MKLLRGVIVAWLLIFTVALAYRGSQHISWTDGTPVPLPAAWFESGDESYGELMHNGNHWEWEITLATVEALLVDGLVGFVVWPLVKKHIHKDLADEHAHEKALEERVKALEDRRFV